MARRVNLFSFLFRSLKKREQVSKYTCTLAHSYIFSCSACVSLSLHHVLSTPTCFFFRRIYKKCATSNTTKSVARIQLAAHILNSNWFQNHLIFYCSEQFQGKNSQYWVKIKIHTYTFCCFVRYVIWEKGCYYIG